MLTPRHACLVAGFLALAPVTASRAEAPIKVADVAPVEDLTAELQDRAKEVQEILATEEGFQTESKKLKQAASVLAVVAQGVVEHGGQNEFAKTAPTIRDAAVKIARGKTYEEAEAGAKTLKAALEGTAVEGAAVDYDWAKLTRMHPSMEEMNGRSAVLRRALRRSKDPELESRHASVLALLGVATYADTHEVKDEADKPQWQAWSKTYQEEMTKTAAAIRDKKSEEAMTHFTAANKTCTECHQKFKN